jgi:hypothetical protein
MLTTPVASGYNITVDEHLNIIIPEQCVVSRQATALPVEITIVPGVAEPTVTATGTLSGGATEVDIRNQSHTLIFTVANDTVVPAGTEFDNARQALIDNLISEGSDANGWNVQVVPNIPVTNVVRTDDDIITVTIPQFILYDVLDDEVINMVMPSVMLVTSSAQVPVSPSFTITAAAGPGTAAISGTLGDINEGVAVAAGGTIILTLQSDTWVSAGGTFDAIRQSIIDGLRSNKLRQKFGFTQYLRDTIGVTDVVRTSDTVVTITVAAAANYDIQFNERIFSDIPGSAVNSGSGVTASGSLQIRAEMKPQTRLSLRV